MDPTAGLLILFSFLLSGCKGDMTDTGNETDVPDKNAVVTESMSEELPVEQTEESHFCSGPGSWGAFMREGFCPGSYAGGGPPGAG